MLNLTWYTFQHFLTRRVSENDLDVTLSPILRQAVTNTNQRDDLHDSARTHDEIFLNQSNSGFDR